MTDIEMIRRTADDLRNAQVAGSSRMLTFGTDLIRNGLTPVIGEFIDRGWLTHLATTFTSVVDDWQAARGGVSQDDCHLINLAILAGNREGLGLGESVARAIRDGRITVPERSLLIEELSDTDELWKVSASAKTVCCTKLCPQTFRLPSTRCSAWTTHSRIRPVLSRP